MGLYSISDLEYMFYAALRNGSVGTIGAKGDPGGFVAATTVNETDLNTLTTPGLYRCFGTNASTLNYPLAVANQQIMVEVITSGSLTVQIAFPNNTAAGTFRSQFVRYYNSGWTAWSTFHATRVDQTAGRAIYQWDSINNREQLIYGDTGWRNLEANATYIAAVDNAATFVRIKREGYSVTVAFRLNISAANTLGANILSTPLPAGFKPAFNMTDGILLETGGNATIVAGQVAGNGDFRVWYSPTTGTMSGIFTFPTNETWPITLPGTANGTIPNL